ncbi:MAG: riboflavin synthase [Alphaproteobacteria bacterium]|nr:riboflavin synthase [Alphaproteobacteria bacterium]
MFTGIVTDVGRVASLARATGTTDTRIAITTRVPLEDVVLGASIACSGCCLTVVEKTAGRFDVQVSAETLARTTLGAWTVGSPVNLERSLKLGDELGGHLVSGHVDGVATVVSRQPEAGSTRFVFELPTGFERLVATKGSIALDGVSLTVNEVEGTRFGVNIIPHTSENTTFADLKAGDRVNFEIDMLARYVARQLDKR